MTKELQISCEKEGQNTGARISKAMRKKLRKEKKLTGRSASVIIRDALEFYFERKDNKNDNINKPDK